MILNREFKVNGFSQKLVGLKHRQKRVRRTIVAGLMLTSMVDMFSLLVIFLLQSFSNSPEVMALSKGIILPAAVSAAAPVDAPLLTITNDEILLDQKSVGLAKDVLSKPEKLIGPLHDLKQSWERSHAKEEFKGDIHLQADKGLSSAMVSRFINIVNSQGYASVHLAVVSGGNR